MEIDGEIKIRVYLFGNLIARIDRNTIELRDNAWNTPTTRRRLNALGDSLAVNFGAWRSVKCKAKVTNSSGEDVSRQNLDKYGNGRGIETIATFETRW